MKNSMEMIYSPRKTISHNSPIVKSRTTGSKVMSKSKTTADLRPTTKAPDFYTLSRLVPSQFKGEKEVLFEENLKLKTQSNEILEENFRMKARIQKLEARKTKNEKKDPNLSLVSALKANINELNEKLNAKDEEVRLLRRNIKTCKIEEKDIEIQELQAECQRLSHHLNELIKQKDLPSSYLENENRVYNKEKSIGRLNQDLKKTQDSLASTKEELTICKEKLQNFEKLTKKTLPVPNEILLLKEEIESLKSKISKILSDSYDKESKLISELRYSRELLDSEVKKSKTLEKESEERNLKIQFLEKQLNSFKSETKTMEIFSSKTQISEKSKDPPRILVKIKELAKEKKLLIPVYLSFLDKNNNGIMEAEELRQGIVLHGKILKKKHVDELLKLMKNESKFIPLRALELLIGKYEFAEEYFSSSEEEIVEPPRARPERLKTIHSKPDPRMNEVVIPQHYSPPTKIQEKIIPLIKPAELQTVFEIIRLQMIDKMVEKNMCINVLFGSYLDFEQLVSVSEVAEYLVSGGVYLGGAEELLKFAKFLIEPEGLEKMKESEHKELRNKVNKFSKKFIKHLPNWETLDKYKQHVAVYGVLISNKQEIFTAAENTGVQAPFVLNFDDFCVLLKSFYSFDNNMILYLYLLSFLSQRQVFKVVLTAVYDELEKFQQNLKTLYEKHKPSILQISFQLEKFSTTYEKVIPYDREVLVNIENFTQSLKSIDTTVDEFFIADLKFGKYKCHLGLLKALLTLN